MEQAELIEKARGAVHTFSGWIDTRVQPIAAGPHPLELASWRKELSLIQTLVDSPERVRVALVGTTGAGKSTLLNAILGQEILPVGVMSPCTAFVTSVRHGQDSRYRVSIQYCTRDEWFADVQNLVAALAPGDTEEGGTPAPESPRIVSAAKKRVRAVYKLSRDEEIETQRILERRLSKEAETVLAGESVQDRDFNSPKEMLKFLRSLIRGDSALWPLVKEVSITGPYEALSGGIELVDLPGLNDPNEARVEITREYLRTSPFVWVVFPMVRGLTEDIRRILQEEKLLRTLVLSGTYGALSLVGTKADDVDVNIADQLGLDDDTSLPELIRAYGLQTITEARVQLAQIALDLGDGSDNQDTMLRMVEMARNVRVHTTSANAYNKLKGVGRLRRDYGLENVRDTGVPQIHEHLAKISNEAGAAFNAGTALARLHQLRDEISFFFRAEAQPQTAKLTEARGRLQGESEAFCRDISGYRDRANDTLRLYREKFLEQLDPLLDESIEGVQQTTVEWAAIHWATLRAIVRRAGAFKSPSTGRSFDLNLDLADPLLSRLPVAWERYFTEELGRVTDEFALRLTEAGKDFCGRVTLIVDLLFNSKDANVEGQLRWFQDKVALLAAGSKNRVVAAVRERRSELAANMPLVAKDKMTTAYDAAKEESGPGMKMRILEHLEPQALQSAEPIFSTIRIDLLEGLSGLEVIITGLYRDLATAAEEQARIITHNANIDVDEATMDPVIVGLLKSLPDLPEAD